MKWGKVIEQNMVFEWRKHYISYKALKKIIKKLKDITDSTNNERYNQLECEFDELVQKDLEDVEVFYKEKECQLLTNFDRLTNEEKSNQLYQLEKYAYLNAEGFRKILKKYDKKLRQNASNQYLPIFKSKLFYYHQKIQQLHANLSTNYEPIMCRYSNLDPSQCQQQCEQCENKKKLNQNMDGFQYTELFTYDYGDNQYIDSTEKTKCGRMILMKYFQSAKHPKIYLMHLLFIFIILSFIALIIIDIYYTNLYKSGNIDYISQKIKFKHTAFNAFLFPLSIFSLCSLMALLICCGKYIGHPTWYNLCKLLFIISSPILITLLFGLSPILVILLTLILIDIEGINSIQKCYNVSYEIMFMHQVNNYYYNKLLKRNKELIKNDYYGFNFYALRVLFLSILHLYRIHDDDIKNMYLEIINRFIKEDDDRNHLKYKNKKCLKYLNDIFIKNNKEFYFIHTNHDQQQSSWLSLLTSFQSYCILFFAVICFHYILWWISFGWSSYSLFSNFKQFSILLQFWAIRDGICSCLCAFYVCCRHKYMYYSMLYDYSWFHQDLRQLILDNLVPNNNGQNFNRRSMKFSKRFDNENNDHCMFVMEHLMPILRHSAIKDTLKTICFDQVWMVNIIMTYLCDFGMYVIPCIDRTETKISIHKT